MCVSLDAQFVACDVLILFNYKMQLLICSLFPIFSSFSFILCPSLSDQTVQEAIETDDEIQLINNNDIIVITTTDPKQLSPLFYICFC